VSILQENSIVQDDIFSQGRNLLGANGIYSLINKQMQLTKKELIEGGWIDKYVLGLTTEEESDEVERLASLYPEVQDQINISRTKICGNFNRNLTSPALRHSFLTKRRVLAGSALVVFISLAGLAFLWREHFSLLANYNSQCARLAEEQAKVDQLASVTRKVSERSSFINSNTTERIKVRGCESTPDAEVLVFKCRLSGKMMLQVVDLPELPSGHHYEVWTSHSDNPDRMIGLIQPPIKYDSLYVLESDMHYSSLQITDVDPVNHVSEPVCLATVSK
jgi:anti-sigma-K factor RskA